MFSLGTKNFACVCCILEETKILWIFRTNFAHKNLCFLRSTWIVLSLPRGESFVAAGERLIPGLVIFCCPKCFNGSRHCDGARKFDFHGLGATKCLSLNYYEAKSSIFPGRVNPAHFMKNENFFDEPFPFCMFFHANIFFEKYYSVPSYTGSESGE